MKYCSSCGNQLADEAKFCNKCGAQQKNDSVEKQTNIEDVKPNPEPQNYQQLIISDTKSTNTSRKFMTPEEAMNKCSQKLHCFKGRAGLAEFWWWYLFLTLFSLSVTYVIDTIIELGMLYEYYETLLKMKQILIFVVGYLSLSAMIRRMHDIGKSGWWILVPIYNLMLLITPGDPQPNAYGNPE